MKGLAIITPLESTSIDKERIYSELYFIDSKNKHKVVMAYMPKSIFKYYFYGVTLEAVELDSNNNCVDVHDVNRDDMVTYGLTLSYGLTMSFTENDIASLATNGFVYYLFQSTFFRRYRHIFNDMYSGMMESKNFVLRYYLMDGEICYVELDCNRSKDADDYKYTMHNGFAVSDRNVLKNMLPKTESEFKDSNEKLSQSEIDKLIDKILSE